MTRPATGDYVTAFVANNPVEAQMIASLLESTGISTYVEGAVLNDEFAASRRLANTMGVEVRIPSSQADRARLVLADYEADRDEVDPETLAQEALSAADPEVFDATPGDSAVPVQGGPDGLLAWMRRNMTELILVILLLPLLLGLALQIA
ncbi:MAG: DUF2007 domain-containing protein [Planctomycetota bacterium]